MFTQELSEQPGEVLTVWDGSEGCYQQKPARQIESSVWAPFEGCHLQDEVPQHLEHQRRHIHLEEDHKNKENATPEFPQNLAENSLLPEASNISLFLF